MNLLIETPSEYDLKPNNYSFLTAYQLNLRAQTYVLKFHHEISQYDSHKHNLLRDNQQFYRQRYENVDMKILNEPEYFYYDNIPVQFFQIPEMTISTEFKVIEDNDILYKVKIED